jgi:hypothetical protein
MFGRTSGTSRKALAGGTSTFVLMDSLNVTPVGKRGVTENVLRGYGKSESQERIYSPSAIPPRLIPQSVFSGGYNGREDRGTGL